MGARPWSASARGLSLAVRLTPKGGRDSIDGVEALADGRAVLKIRVRVAPSEGEANEALVRLLARALDLPTRAVTITAGHTARLKRIAIDGDASRLSAKLEKLVGND
ncbi:MAG: DUF167 domain-containing protein [Pseudorhodoplanes sp.]|nr:hypothetical protein [Pseudorhodoplanes sp.]MBW7949190.1 DUF167 domain-containing protein [Pseudorhodoplanes sp.]MCL4710880.1 DUF167 domain-containing protein [Pseudorhodoplanes sp.]MCQ3943296.1 DUF167 domain-containing protein [Alphaproteobacteria bacterium]